MNQKPITISAQTKEKVEAAKIFIQQRYSKLIMQEKQKREYWEQLNQKMKNLNIPQHQQDQIKNKILHKEAQKLRNQRKKFSITDFPSVKIIGKGAFGQVRLCKWSKNNQPVAVKKLKKQQMIYKNKVIQVRQQRNVLANSQKNPWIVRLQCSFQDPQYLYLVMDYVPGGDLMNLLIKKDIFSHEEAKFYTAEMIAAIESVHNLKYIHRDIKPDNVLIDETGHIKLSDFGLCKHTQARPKKLIDNIKKKQQQNMMQSLKNKSNSKRQNKHRRKLAYSAVGTPDYVAPQVQGKGGYTETVDWWAVGVILFEMLVGYPPFASQNSSITWQKIQNWRKFLVIPSDVYVSPQAADLIRRLVNDPNQRLGSNGVEQIKAHPFFKGIDWKNIRNTKAPNIPQLKNPFDTSNFDMFQEQQPWVPVILIKNKGRSNKKGTQFIGYTFKPEQQANSQLLKALIDLDNYRIPQQLHRNNLESFNLQDYGIPYSQMEGRNNIFKKGTTNGKLKQQFYATTTIRSPKYSLTNNSKQGWTQYSQKVLSPGSKARNMNLNVNTNMNMNHGVMSNTNYNNFNNIRVQEQHKSGQKKQVVKIFQKKSSNQMRR